MKMDVENERSKLTEEFKNRIFAHAFAHQNADLFYEMYPEYAPGGAGLSHNEEEWEIPRSEEELRELMGRWDVRRIS